MQVPTNEVKKHNSGTRYSAYPTRAYAPIQQQERGMQVKEGNAIIGFDNGKTGMLKEMNEEKGRFTTGKLPLLDRVPCDLGSMLFNFGGWLADGLLLLPPPAPSSRAEIPFELCRSPGVPDDSRKPHS
ncbi:hypothetical protein GJ744_009126 [Endocarpon pusillum]|uniref:Uncharacterized protein n=1 Tax=Endocarpon pusillum TaxID=364733 RepID=A0A8H7AIK4_9EURO|nr:hypothetical protein GJ744_009126 [Endocarpon pusillum]